MSDDLTARFLRAAADHPHRVAVRAQDGALDFAELDARTAGLAATLAAHGAGRGSRVGVHLRRTTDLLVALLAVWRAGAAYVPLDPAYPAERLAFLAADAGVALVISADDAPAVPAGLVIVRPGSRTGGPVPQVTSLPGDPAYVIHTSGSTGPAKGVEVSRGSAAFLVAALEGIGAYRPEPAVVAWNASVSFDASVQQWARVCRGDTVVVLSDDERGDPSRLAAVVAEFGVTDLDLTPSHWELLRETLAGRSALRLFMGGEPVPERTWREIEAAGITALNLYGPTECTVDATAAWIGGPGPHIGRALPGVGARILDAGLRPVAEGETGELYLAGPGVALGYTGRAALTAQRFTADPAGPAGGRMYRTGDLARQRADGALEFVGRSDRQVKLRGFRIEPGEIENALRIDPDVRDTAVDVKEFAPGDRRLIAYVTGGAGLSPQDVRRRLEARLPAHMVPSEVVALAAMPLTPSGKTDYRALPVPESRPEPRPAAAAGDRAAAVPGSPEPLLLEQVAEVWRTVLGVSDVGPSDDFLLLGGHSLAALRVVHTLRRTLGVGLQLRHLLDARDLADFTESVRAAMAAGPATTRPSLPRRTTQDAT
ncbi:non-ribosomal peptide synthetase [Actinacidiphila rubida]|uniref:Amino acid adenylation domain-containing protein n=1 Tax=Actinacidiphila rubida TaxID=310780 RepID=A0A1H8KAH8_9ACTN|nr:non-ribosomal peptide synthetase [Actinacidiphila rubida]SEN89924.1 amino acid adenylation domain-containing protein [Actinacidiphila rubida]